MIKNKIILITGARKGIGRKISEHFIANSNNIVIGCSRNKTNLKSKNYFHFEVDVSEEEMVKQMFSIIRKKFKRIDILINNAGVASMNHLILTPTKTFDKLNNTNFKGTFLMIREASKLMIPRKDGRIINFTSVASPMNLEGEAIYASTKAAVEKLTKISAKELADFGITVNAIGPTPIMTDLIKAVPKNKINDLLQNQSIKRFGEFTDVINVITFLIDKKSNFITGQIIYLGGL